MKWNLAVLALAASMAWATGAYADTITLNWSVSSIPDAPVVVTGSGTFTYNNSTTYDGSYYLITSMTGSLTIGGVGGAISNFVTDAYVGGDDPGTTPGTIGTDPTGAWNFDNLIDPFASPVGLVDGVVFNIPGFEFPVNLAGPWEGYPYSLWDYDPGQNGNYGPDPDYNYYQLEPPSVTVSEPSVISLLSLGLVG